jgi:prevent-host-death family protein
MCSADGISTEIVAHRAAAKSPAALKKRLGVGVHGECRFVLQHNFEVRETIGADSRRTAASDCTTELAHATTRDYNSDVKPETSTRLTEGEPEMSSVIQEMAPKPGIGLTISVRAAKAHLSGLLEEVASGREVVITSDGVPKARLVPIWREAQRPVFTGTREHLATMPKWSGGPTAEELVREDRDGRGW